MTTQIKLILLCALILSGCLLFWGYSLRVNSDLKGENKLLIEQYQKELQARRNLEKMVTKRDSLYSRLRRIDKAHFDSLLTRSTKTITKVRQNEKVYSKPFNEPVLDSLVSAIVR